jgi:hypothetical protein
MDHTALIYLMDRDGKLWPPSISSGRRGSRADLKRYL